MTAESGGFFYLLKKSTRTFQFNRQIIKYYYDYKRRNNYDEDGIARNAKLLRMCSSIKAE